MPFSRELCVGRSHVFPVQSQIVRSREDGVHTRDRHWLTKSVKCWIWCLLLCSFQIQHFGFAYDVNMMTAIRRAQQNKNEDV